ncbi:ComF family protein [Hydrogenimonas cancrithermarum]|uniref:Phosphoribosyltransferase n=1 Tax=Hydrogenimonas cancrithermarum TaxID=2993563 RepID=A0ABM8FJP8_9BACT|nr:ComF family protein [Hydrogenimonas cancrithermarum]BDY12524.1 phosphoribosyltransferase [Hydrogenimonas cancrithermarum]
MRCLSCRRLSFSLLCSVCREHYLKPEPRIRKLETGLEVISFYAYDEIEPFLLTKHLPHGWFIYRILAKEAFKALSQTKRTTFAIPVDDDPSGGYSHTAILAKGLKRYGYRPLFGRLHAQNRLSYSGQPLAFRVQNPRDFRYTGPTNIDAVLVDDIITTGLTLKEAHGRLLQHGVDLLGAFVLADVDRA